MRWMRDVVAAIGLLGLVGGTLYLQRERREEDALFQHVQTDVRRMELEIKYRAATKTTELNARGWPVTIDPSWFKDKPPVNTLLNDDRPWVEVAGTAQAELMHPPVRMAVDKSLAAFWYNPYQGVVRARVPVMVSDDKATELYNRINGVGMPSIFVRESVADRPKSAEPAATDPAAPAAPPTSSDKEADKPVATFTIRSSDHRQGKR
jgi:hypothetical protein